MRQPSFFDVRVERLGPCAFSASGEGWLGRHHCDQCAAFVDRSVAAMAEARERGEYDAQGYTAAERRQLRRAA